MSILYNFRQWSW